MEDQELRSVSDMELQKEDVIIKRDDFDSTEASHTFLKVGKTMLFFVLLQVAMGFVLGILTAGPMVLPADGFVNAAGITMWLSMLVTLICNLLVARHGMKQLQVSKASLHVKNPWSIVTCMKLAMIGIGLSMCGSFVINLINLFLSPMGMQFTMNDLSLQNNMMYNIALILSVLIIAPILEEVIFRGVITQTLARYDRRFAIIVGSLLFAMMHMNVIQAGPTFLLGLVLSYAYVMSGSLLPSIIIHFCNNLLAVLVMLVPMSNVTLTGILGFCLLALMITALTITLRKRKQIKMELASHAREHHLYRLMFSTWSFLIFAVLFLLSSFLIYMVLR